MFCALKLNHTYVCTFSQEASIFTNGKRLYFRVMISLDKVWINQSNVGSHTLLLILTQFTKILHHEKYTQPSGHMQTKHDGSSYPNLCLHLLVPYTLYFS